MPRTGALAGSKDFVDIVGAMVDSNDESGYLRPICVTSGKFLPTGWKSDPTEFI